MKTYSKTHKSKKALDSHVAKIRKRGGSYQVKGNAIVYRFPEKAKDTSITASSTSDLIIEAANKGYGKVNVEFYPAYDSKEHSKLPTKLKDSLKKAKVETFDVVEDAGIIVKLKKSKNVNKIYFV